MISTQSLIATARAARITQEKRAEFGWNGTAPAPHERGGVLVIQPQDRDQALAVDSPFENEIGKVITRFIPAVLSYGMAKGLSGYQDRVARTLVECGLPYEDSTVLTRLAWMVIFSGLSNLCSNIDKWYEIAGENAGVPMAPLHLWALGEAAACYLMHLDPNADCPEVAADAKFLDKYFGAFALNFNIQHAPYTALVILQVE